MSSSSTHRAWTARKVEDRLTEAYETLARLPDIETRYLRNALRSRFPEVAETAATAFAAAVGAWQAEGAPREFEVVPGCPSPAQIDRMEAVMLGLPKASESAFRPWLNWLSERRRRLVWRRLAGREWGTIAVQEKRSIRTCQRWFIEAMEQIADELTTLDQIQANVSGWKIK